MSVWVVLLCYALSNRVSRAADNLRFRKCKFPSRENTNSRIGIFRRSKTASAGKEIASCEFVANSSWTGLSVLQAKSHMLKDLLRPTSGNAVGLSVQVEARSIPRYSGTRSGRVRRYPLLVQKNHRP
jgi:hypothetical protein